MGTRPPPPSQSLLVTQLAGATTLDQRIAIAHQLADLGDPRIATDRVEIAPGSSHGAYAIDRYPVTVAAFSAFVDDGGYDDPGCWTTRGWSWRTRARISSPRFWDEAEWAAYLVPNHPVVGVSFYEAEAYASFVDARLPTQWEWERAATGGDDRKYPWGEEWQDDASGQRGTGPRSTVPIGVFAKGMSPDGVFDMVGCVWQWCSDKFSGLGDADEGTGDDEDGDDSVLVHRVTCGGAWNTLAWSITCQSRNGYPETARFSNIGFRCVTSRAQSDGARR